MDPELQDYVDTYDCQDMLARENDGPVGQQDHEDLAVQIPGIDS